MNKSTFDTAFALGEMDDALVSEAANAAKPKKSRLPWLIPAAAALVIAAGAAIIVPKLMKDPDDNKSAHVVPIATAENTASPGKSTGEPTDPATETLPPFVDPSAEPPVSPMPTEPDETPALSETIEPHPTTAATPLPTAKTTPRPTEKTTPAPDPTSPPEMESREFNSIGSFISAVQSGSDPFLNGIDCWYSFGNGVSLDRIVVAEDEVFYYYALSDGSELLLEWFRSEEASQRWFNHFTSFDGEWHDELYLVCSQAGIYFGYTMDNGHFIRMRGTEIRTVVQALECYAPIRHEL